MLKEKTIYICAICEDEIANVDEYYFNLENKECYHLDCFLEKQREAKTLHTLYDTKLRKFKSSRASFRGRAVDSNSSKRS